ncbi:RNA polymerase sigma-70 factor (ECF subfamily) [Neomicrococcus aestuarii]|uniref:RNA polymerase sigma-70 factor (ECF subfamily) n=1 Tax=Neomicrococcus aestuarii TaxID=556325 RepID=A0A7W8WYX0_9MICC|nr:sigma-70 family RNA polymerase sigma factor [Neomicrococcus aestuarii]MBB5511700.1 RNA polymerase sigma-70 factor (ECF subfamily) [Neomicrococcus aestuarii]
METTHDIDALYQAHAVTVQRFIYRRVFNVDDANELTNDVFRVAWQKQQAGTNIDIAWLVVTAKNLILNMQRGSYREVRLRDRLKESALLTGSPHDSGISGEVGEVLDQLREKDREILILAYWDGLRAADLAKVLDCSEGSAATRLNRARQAFAKKAPAHLMNPSTTSTAQRSAKEA